jgi:hypothetical protein
MVLCRRVLALVLVSAFATLPAGADPSDRSGSARAQAAKLFDEAERAFDHGDYLRAAQSFERAHDLAPNVDTLWNAARSWDRGGDYARAATKLVQYLHDSPANARDRSSAQARLTQLSRRLVRLDLHAPEDATLELDQERVTAGVRYVNPGSHIAVATSGESREQKNLDVKEGDTVSVNFDVPATARVSPAAIPLVSPPAHEAQMLATPGAALGNANAPGARVDTIDGDASRRRRWSPWVFAGTLTLTAAAGGLTAWSGVSTLSALSTFNAHATKANLSTGQDDQLRTNALIGATAGLACLTLVTGIWLTDWQTSRNGDVHVSANLGGVDVRWSF